MQTITFASWYHNLSSTECQDIGYIRLPLIWYKDLKTMGNITVFLPQPFDLSMIVHPNNITNEKRRHFLNLRPYSLPMVLRQTHFQPKDNASLVEIEKYKLKYQGEHKTLQEWLSRALPFLKRSYSFSTTMLTS